MPALGLGTWKSREGDAYRAVKEALRVGYRHIDGAWIYQNEEEVGRGIRESIQEGVVERGDIFLTSKLWNSFHAPESVEAGCRETLNALGLEYLDLYLMHWPVAFRSGKKMPQGPDDFWPLSEMPVAKTFEAMVKLRDQGLVKSVGVSNFGVSRLEQLISESGHTPAVNQVELHPYNPQNELLAYCQEKGIYLTAYSPLGSSDRPASMKASDEPPLLDNPIVKDIAAEEGITPGQLLIAWAIDRGTSVIPKSVNPSRIAENFAIASHTLSSKARAALDGIDTRFRYVEPKDWFFPGITYTGESFWA
ncbi:aldo/keto reductase [Leptolyngbya sp. FACHB-16]|nr:aldo/keto reductase [Leptolyngbya sp. FACHB-8]MBD2154499.1 aldo/keto reductase [Leptolyngbya sp. FACHB-16]